MRFLILVLAVLAGTPLTAATCPSITWPQRQLIPTGRWVQKVVSLDINSDGKLDLAGLYGAVDASRPYTIVTWLGNGDGTFGNATTLYMSSTWLPSLNTADVNQDGHGDLITSEGDVLLVFHGTGGGFSLPVRKDIDGQARDITVGNFDADSAPELIASATNEGFVMVFDNVNGQFMRTGTIDTGLWPMALTSADFNGDGLHDVAVVKRTAGDDAVLLVYFRADANVFGTPKLLPSGRFPINVKAADFNGDGHMDLAAANWTDGNANLYLNDGTGTFSSKTIELAIPRRRGNSDAMLVDDLSGDGVPDLTVATTNGGWLTTMVGVGDGTFRTPTWQFGVDPFNVHTFSSLVAADFDNDGDSDLAGGGASSLLIANRACATQVMLTPKAPTITAGQDATLLVHVSGFAPGIAAPFGTVTLKKNGTTIESKSVDANGQASFTVSGLTVGNHAFTADFSGNSDIAAASSATATLQVTTTVTTVTLTTPTSPPVYGQDWPVSVTVQTPNYSSPEWVTLTVDGVSTRFYSSNPYVLRLAPGPHTIVAEYEGAYHLPPGKSETVNVTALKASPSLTFTGATAIRAGQPFTLTFQLNGVNGVTGTLQLFVGDTVIVSSPVSAAGAATIQTLRERGSHDVHAIYSGDANHNGATIDFSLHVLPQEPVWVEARSVAGKAQVVYVMPYNAQVWGMMRRPAGDPWLVSWTVINPPIPSGGLDPTTLETGVVYEYQILVRGQSGEMIWSNIDGVVLFSDDPVTTSTPIRRAHFTELRDAVNLMRAAAKLPAFSFDASFTSPYVQAKHVTALREAITDARKYLGMTIPVYHWTPYSGLPVRAQHIRDLRDWVR